MMWGKLNQWFSIPYCYSLITMRPIFHEAHISLRALDLAKSKGIVMLTIPPHTSHRLQPLDKSVYGPFKTYYNRALDGWMRSNPGKTASIYHIPVCVNEAFMSAMTPQNICSGFRSTGIFPYNRYILSDAEFEPSMVSDRPNPDVLSTFEEDQPIASTSTSPGYVSPTEILPFPKSQQPRAQTKRKRVKTSIMTPEKQALEMKHEKRKNKLKGKQITSIKEQGKSKKKQTKKKSLVYSSSKESDVPIPLDDTV
ncbi:uncharacterized protein LOC119495270 isoform X1 [Tachysurus ichikawai]